MAKAKPHNWRKWNEFRMDSLNEGPAYEYADHIKNIEKLYDAYWDSIKDFEKLLKSKGLKKEATTISAYYHKLVGKFDTIFKKLVSTLM